jgi:putative transposase
MMPVSERRVCSVLGQHRSTQRTTPHGADHEAQLTDDIIVLARQYGRYGYRRVTAPLQNDGWYVNRKQVERIWRREWLKVHYKQPKCSRLWLNDGSCIRASADEYKAGQRSRIYRHSNTATDDKDWREDALHQIR